MPREDKRTPVNDSWFSRRWVIVYFIVLFLALLLFFSSSFSNPPRSDYWSAYYFFHLVDASPQPPQWYHVLTYDPWSHGTFRPFSFFILYLQHRFFGAAFFLDHISNFLMYFLSLLLLYRLSRHLELDRVLTAGFLAVLAFLFSHFDIVTWTFHIYSLTACSAMLLGFNLYLSYLKTARRILLLPTALFFLFGMLTYEVFALWPLALLILAFAPDLAQRHQSLTGKDLRFSYLAVLPAVYLLYIGAFALSQAIGAWSVGPIYGPRAAITSLSVIGSAAAVFFNLAYVGVMVNLAPTLAVPATVYDNIDMGGMLLNWGRSIIPITLVAGFTLAGLTAAWWFFLRRRGKTRTASLLLFLLFLLFAFFYVVALARSTTNSLIYTYTQFRYQYTANALAALIAVAVIQTLLRPSGREKAIVLGALVPVLASNLYVSSTYIGILKIQLTPLYAVISNIKTGIANGKIDEKNRILIEDKVTATLPPLCWNEDMSLFMKGTYQWLFAKDELSYFTFNRSEAAWIIPENDYRKVLSAAEAAQAERP
jgi:hypothetical protein